MHTNHEYHELDHLDAEVQMQFGRKRRVFWSKLLCCRLEFEQKESKSGFRHFEEHFNLWLIHQNVEKHLRLDILRVLKSFIRFHNIGDDVHIKVYLRRLVADERRKFLYGPESTARLMDELAIVTKEVERLSELHESARKRLGISEILHSKDQTQ